MRCMLEGSELSLVGRVYLSIYLYELCPKTFLALLPKIHLSRTRRRPDTIITISNVSSIPNYLQLKLYRVAAINPSLEYWASLVVNFVIVDHSAVGDGGRGRRLW